MQQGRLARGGQIDPPAWGRPPAPVEAQGPVQGPAPSLGTLQGRRDQGLEPLPVGGRLHAQEGGRAVPALKMGIQQPGLPLLHQHRFKQAIGQGQAAIIEGQAQLVGPAPLAPLGRLAGVADPGDWLGIGLAGLWRRQRRPGIGPGVGPGVGPGGRPPSPSWTGWQVLAAGHAKASSRGWSFQPSSSASPAGSESATMPQPAWTRSRWPLTMALRIRMLLSKLPSAPRRNREPQ